MVTFQFHRSGNCDCQRNFCISIYQLHVLVISAVAFDNSSSGSSHQKCSIKKMFLKILQNSQQQICARVSFLIKLQVSASNLIKKEALVQVFSCEFCEIFKNTFFTEYLWSIASEGFHFMQHLISHDCFISTNKIMIIFIRIAFTKAYLGPQNIDDGVFLSK